jgi:hypothetical protein
LALSIAIASTVAAWQGQTGNGWITSTTTTPDYEIVLPPYVELVTFDISFGNRHSSVTIFPPETRKPLRAVADGSEGRPGGGYFSTVAIRHPRPGRWAFRAPQGGTRVRVFSLQFLPRGLLTILHPHDVIRQNDRVTLAYQLYDSSGRPLHEMSAYPLRLRMSVINPAGSCDVLGMTRDRGPTSVVFRSRSPLTCGEPGRYWTRVALFATDAAGQSVQVFEDRWSGFTVTPP